MGQIIKVTGGENELPAALTETEESGFRSGAYLADRPAIEFVEADETVAFVTTNRKQGITIVRDTTRHVTPDSRHQTVVVVTDRRILVLVGMADGDRQFALDISEITDVATTTGRQTGQLTTYRADGPTWKVHTGTSGITELADYLRAQSDACRTGGRVRATSGSIQGLFESTVDTAKSLKRDRVTEMIPGLSESPSESGDDAGDRDGASSAAAREPAAETTESSDELDTEAVIHKIMAALAKTDWRARSAQAESPFDLLAEREDELVGIVVHCPEDGRIGRRRIEQCEAITGAAGTDTVMLATTGEIDHTDARLAADLGVRLRNVETLADTTNPPTIEAVTEMVSQVLVKSGWSIRPGASGPFDLLADSGDELMGVVVHSPEDGAVRDSIEHCNVITGAAGTDTVMLATTGTVRDADERLSDELGVRLVQSDSLGQRHVTEIR